MACEICGRSSCTKSFHSMEDQDNFDNTADVVKDRAKEYISHRLNRLEYEHIEDVAYIKLDDAIKIVEDYN